ncbi:MAG: M14 family metallopeptidase [Lewinella sp.]
MIKFYQLSFLLLVFLTACTSGAKRYNFPVDVNTSTKLIKTQEKKNYVFSATGLTFDNLFAGARLNGVEKREANVYEINIEAENEPINPSPWYAFRIRAERSQEVVLRMRYPENVRHRYFPKISQNRKQWMPLDSSVVLVHPDKTGADISLSMVAGTTLFLAGQEIINSDDVADWQKGMAFRHADVIHPFVAGKSKLGRDLPAFSIRNGPMDDRPTIVLLSRQHPPEVTGFLCLQAFLDGILDHPQREAFLEKYQLLVYPLLNPDGVDMGHWRHGAGGIDGNRDWAKYRQPEAREVANSIVSLAKESGSRVVLGMDFHSTYRDVYYTHMDEVQPPTALPGFKDAWLQGIEDGIGGDFVINEDPEMIGKPTTMSWFRTQFGAEGITYEIGDGTDRDFVRRKGLVSANALIEVLLK